MLGVFLVNSPQAVLSAYARAVPQASGLLEAADVLVLALCGGDDLCALLSFMYKDYLETLTLQGHEPSQ